MKNGFEELKQNLLPRFWNTENKEMLYSKKMFDGIVYYKDDNHTLSMLLSLPQFIPMKPTGLKDKNGQLIYEGDIVKNERMLGTVSFIANSVDKRCGFFIFNPETYSVKSLFDADLGCFEEFEIIGNIHSNPELVEVQK